MTRSPDAEAGGVSRRQFLHRAGAVAVGLTGFSALDACGGSNASGPGGRTYKSYLIGTESSPITLPTHGKPIATDTPIERNATLQLFNWASYLWPGLIKQFEAKYKQYNVKVALTTFNNESEALLKLSQGLSADAYWPTIYVLDRLVAGKLLQPLNHDLVPNLRANFWTEFQNPFYDQGWQYTVPYVIWTTGIGYRRDHISDGEVAAKGYDILADQKYKGKVGFYDDWHNAIAMALLKLGITDVNTSSTNDIDRAKQYLISLVTKNKAGISINGAYVKLPAGQVWAHQAWSGDIVNAKSYLPKGTSTDVLGYWYPPQGGVVGSDIMAIPASAKHPRLAHEWLNFMLEKTNAYNNFVQYTGYEPPLLSLDPVKLVPTVVPSTIRQAAVTERQVHSGHYLTDLPPSVITSWTNAWDQIKAA